MNISVKSITVESISVPGLTGKQGEKGEKGEQGLVGKSAYELAKENGFTGTVDEWLLSLRGPKGDSGERGEKGLPGDSAVIPDNVLTTDGTKALPNNMPLYGTLPNNQLFPLIKVNNNGNLEVGRSKDPVQVTFCANDLKMYDGKNSIRVLTSSNLSDYGATKAQIQDIDNRLNDIKVPDVNVDEAAQLLRNNNIWADNTINGVLTALINNLGKEFPRTEYIPLNVPSVDAGQTSVEVTGEPHYAVKVGDDVRNVFELDEYGAATITIPPLGEDDIELTYYNIPRMQVATYTIRGTLGEPDDSFTDSSGIKFYKYGRKVIMDCADISYYGSINFLGKWDKNDVDIIEFKAKRAGMIRDKADKPFKYDGLTFYVQEPRNISFYTEMNPGKVTINTPFSSQQNAITSMRTEWDVIKNKYVQSGGTVFLNDM